MRKIQFFKYQGTGNDFVLIDNYNGQFNVIDSQLVEWICHRRFGVGADGLMLLEKSENAVFKMRYYNSDGRESTMCGNGGRCIAAFATDIGVAPKGQFFTFSAIDGEHEAMVEGDMVSLKMIDVHAVKNEADGLFLDTGSPHFVIFVDDPMVVDVAKEGCYWRNHENFAPGGTNVNFVGTVDRNNEVVMRTYERGVEEETWSCGTGAVASAIATHIDKDGGNNYSMKVPGGRLNVSFEAKGNGRFENIWLKGSAKFVFEGKLKYYGV